MTVAAGTDGGSPTDVAVSVAVSVAAFAAPPGTETWTQTSADAPLATLTDVNGVVHVASRTVAVNAPDATPSVYESSLKLLLVMWNV